MDAVTSFAREFRDANSVQGQKKDDLSICRNNFWKYEKYINPKFFREDRPHLKIIATVLQALYEGRIVKANKDDKWQIVSFEERKEFKKEELLEDGTTILVPVKEDELFVCKQLMMNIPPRHGKSYTMSLFADWLFGVDNENKIIAITYNDILAGRFSKNVRDGIAAEKMDERFHVFSDVFPETKIRYGDSAVSMWSLEGQFFNYLGAGFGGTITGVGCSLGIIDDPVKNDTEAFNDDFLNSQYSWYTDTFLSRIEEGGMQIIIMTRWSENDLTGKLLADEDGTDWYELKMQACEDEALQKMLCPELFSFNSYMKKKRKMSPQIFMANYQQDPFCINGALYTSFKTYDALPVKSNGKLAFSIIQAYCDTADEGDDYLCSIVYGVLDMEAYVLDVVYTQDKMEITEHLVANSFFTFNVNYALIESNNGGKGFARQVADRLKNVYKTNKTTIKWFYNSAYKPSRISSNSTWVMEHIYFPVDWMYRWPKYFKAMTKYKAKGKNKHDDAADATTGVAESITGRRKKAKIHKKSRYGFN